MKHISDTIKKCIAAFATIILLLFILYFFIKQPLFIGYRFSDSSIPSELYLTNQEKLKEHVKFLSSNNRTSEEGQKIVVDYILADLKKNGIHEENIVTQSYIIDGREYKNIIVSFRPEYIPKEKYRTKKIIIGGHYDAYDGLPGADDNASAIAGLLEISRILHETKLYNGRATDMLYKGRAIDLVFYSTEEPPFYATENMGSFHHAKSITENIDLVIILEMIGYFSELENSQSFPIPFLRYLYPTKGNFIAIVSNFSNVLETRKVKNRFRAFLMKNNLITVESINAPSIVTGIDFSDHRNYWKFDIPAVMITDTSFYRNFNYHTPYDTYEKLDYKKMKEVVDATIATALTY